jgi:deoxyribonuclease-4
MKVGAHLWIEGGLLRTIEYCKYLKCNCFQIFLSNPRSWKRRYRDKYEIDRFKEEIEKMEIEPIVVHMPYIFNIAEENKKIKEKIIRFLEEEIEESIRIGAEYYVVHPGFHKGLTEERGLRNVIELLKNFVDTEIKILIENTSGQGTSLGYNFKQLSYIVERLNNNFAICFDIAHAFQSGYDMKNFENVRRNIEKFVDLSYILLIHANDSKTKLGSKIDRHQHIGKGEIGEIGFEEIIKDEYFGNLPFIIETPKATLKEDKKNIEILKRIGERHGKISTSKNRD